MQIKRNSYIKTAGTLLFITMITACSWDDVPPARDLYAFKKPENFPSPVYTFENNPFTKEGIELGQALFYDPILSRDSSIACASCHQQVVAFADPVHRLSKGIEDREGIRNAPALQNLAFQSHFFWDGGVNHLDFVPINAITSEIEMAEKLSFIVEKMNRSKIYPGKFKRVFGEDKITTQKLFYSLSQFMAMMISANSRYDKFIRNEGEVLTQDELDGMKLFKRKCAGCHATDLFTDGSFRNDGLNATFELDSGRSRITESSQDQGKFKVPSLRNAELTAPYMHDGRFKTLNQVLDHYAQEIVDSETLDPDLKQNNTLGIAVTEAEKTKIIAFIKTLTDRTFTSDKRFSNPFF
jgi:cytochrome c peroxidase